MIQENLPSVDSLVSRIRSRINSKYSIQGKNSRNVKSPVKQLSDGQLGQIPVLQWDQIQCPIHKSRRHQSGQKPRNLEQSFPQQQQIQTNSTYNPAQTQLIRNLTYCNLQKDIPRAPRRRYEGDNMKKLIYQAKYSKKPINQPCTINYDYQYAKHQQMYRQVPVYSKPKERSKIRSVLQKDRLSGKKYDKFSNQT